MFLDHQILGQGPSKFLSEFYKFGHHRTCGKTTSEIVREKKKEINDSGKTERPAASIASRQP